MNYSEDYCPVNPATQEELSEQLSKRMARYNESERVALGNMIANAESSMEMSEAYGQDIMWSERNAECQTLIEMKKALPPVEYVKNTIGNMFPELAQLKAA